MRQLIFINISFAILWILAFLMSLIHFPYLIYLVGVLIFFLPGLNLVFAGEQITKSRQGVGKILLWTIIISLILNSTFIYVGSSIFHNLANNNLTLIIFGVWLAFSFFLALTANFFKKIKPTKLKINYKNHRPLFWGLGLFLLFFIILLLTYSYIPEADSYTYLGKMADLLNFHKFILAESRPLFLSLTWSLSFLTQIPAYFLYKIIFPLVTGLSLVFLFYLSAKENLKTNFGKFIGAVSIIFIPVIIQEILISRPQQIFMLVFPIILFLLVHILLKRKNKQEFQWLLLLLLLATFGFLIHEFFLFPMVILMIGMIVFWWTEIKKYPWETFLIFSFLLFFSYLFLQNLGIWNRIDSLFSPFLNILLHPKFTLWFLDNYSNVSGTQMGWSGIGQLFYYGYNLGLIFPILAIIIIFKKIKVNWQWSKNWPYFIGFLLFFAIAEIFPRLGLFYLPDRAWLFVSLFLIFFIPLGLVPLEQYLNQKKWQYIFIFLLIISLMLSWLVTYLKQGWVTHQEIQAVEFIKKDLPDNAVFITQGSNNVLINYFGNRLAVTASKTFFYGNLNQSDLNLINNLSDYISHESQTKKVIENARVSFNQQIDNLLNGTYGVDDLQNDINVIENGKISLLYIDTKGLDKKRPVYILYSRDKFSGLYGNRAWWRKNNFYGANLKKFDTSANFQKIYDQSGVIIWKFK